MGRAIDAIDGQQVSGFLQGLAASRHVRAPPKELLDNNLLLKNIFKRVSGLVYVDSRDEIWILIAPDVLEKDSRDRTLTFIHEAVEAYLLEVKHLSSDMAHHFAEIEELHYRYSVPAMAENMNALIKERRDQ